MLERQNLRYRGLCYDGAKEVFSLAVAKAREVNRPVLSFDSVSKARLRTRAASWRRYLHSQPRLRAGNQPVDSLVGHRGVDSGAVELHCVGWIELAVLFAFDDHRDLNTVHEQLQVPRIDIRVEPGRNEVGLGHSVPSFLFHA